MKKEVLLFWLCLALGLMSFVSGCSQAVTPSTFLIDPAVLAANRQKIELGDNVLSEALAGLKEEAEVALTEGPFSVTHKTKIPPSGDKRDYMSMGTYWWPDPTKPDGLPYIRKDGITNPEIAEIKDHAYFSALCSNVSRLAVACYFTGEGKYAGKAAELLRVWFLDDDTRMNPHLNYGQAIPGITEGRGIGLIDTRALVHLIDGIQLLNAHGALTAAEYEGLQNWFRQYLEWMTTSPIGLDESREHNNHGTYYDIQTIAIALFIDRKDRALQMINDYTKARIEKQLEDDGRQPHELARTLSWTYSQMNLAGFFELAQLAENVEVDLWNYVSPGGKSIKKAFVWMLSHVGDQPWEYQQIRPVDKSGFINLVKIASVKYPDVDMSVFFDKYPEKKPDNLFILTR